METALGNLTITSINETLHEWLGDPAIFGSSSWFEIFYWLAGIAVVMVAAMSLRRTYKQSRALLLLQIDDKWRNLFDERQTFTREYNAIRETVISSDGATKDRILRRKIRDAARDHFRALRTSNSATEREKFYKIIAFAGLFEVIGSMVRRGDIPLGTVNSIYKLTILQLGDALGQCIKDWEAEADMPKGLLSNLLYLHRRVKNRDRWRGWLD